MGTKILHLTLLREWFDEIASSRKREEFRLVTPYWKKRLEGRSYDEIHFRNGYSKDAPFLRVKCNWVKRGQTYYVISLGEILEIRNYKEPQ